MLFEFLRQCGPQFVNHPGSFVDVPCRGVGDDMPDRMALRMVFPAEAEVIIKLEKFAISLHHIKPDAEVKFSKTDRAQMKGPCVAFLQMV